MGILISIVASKSTFSTGEKVLDAYKSSLLPKIVQALICTQDWMYRSSPFNDVEDDLTQLEKVDQDLFKITLDWSLTSEALLDITLTWKAKLKLKLLFMNY